MNKQYLVIFEECAGFHAGDVVKGSDVASSEAGLEYLLAIGAIEEKGAKKAVEPVDAAALTFGQKMAAAKAAKKAAEAGEAEIAANAHSTFSAAVPVETPADVPAEPVEVAAVAAPVEGAAE